jgi:hypothetical protein
MDEKFVMQVYRRLARQGQAMFAAAKKIPASSSHTAPARLKRHASIWGQIQLAHR